jgi:hypothetical protein
MCREREYILLLLREMETGFSAIWNGEPQKQPLMPSSVSFWLYKLAGKSYYSGPGEYRSGGNCPLDLLNCSNPRGLNLSYSYMKVLEPQGFHSRQNSIHGTFHTQIFLDQCLMLLGTGRRNFGISKQQILLEFRHPALGTSQTWPKFISALQSSHLQPGRLGLQIAKCWT